MLKRASILAIGALFAFSTIVAIEPASAAPVCTPTTTTSGMKTILRFTTVGTCSWDVPAGVTEIGILIVGGGGGGGGDAAGGGGAGGLYLNPSLAINSSTKTIQVGAGGAGGQCSSGNGGECTTPTLASAGFIEATNGSPSVFDSISVAGGGKGGVYNSGAGGNGGSGGGGASSNGTGGTTTISGTFYYGNNGGTGLGMAAGGGGAGAQGTGGSNGTGGNGGAGIATDISGVMTTYAGGGGGGGQSARGVGGAGGGGSGAESCTYRWSLGTDSRQAQAGTPNTGGGGGGAPHGCAGSAGAGGSGIVIISYTLIPSIASLALSTGVKSATYRTVNTIQATLSSDGRVRFFINGKQIPGCINVSSTSRVASCTWKPSIRGGVNLSARVIGGSSTAQLSVGVLARTNRR
jgi:hypothetical protein